MDKNKEMDEAAQATPHAVLSDALGCLEAIRRHCGAETSERVGLSD